jgi:hypothetical protein
MAAPAQADAGAACEPEFIAILIADREFTLDPQWTVASNSDFSQISLLFRTVIVRTAAATHAALDGSATSKWTVPPLLEPATRRS